MIPRYQRPAMQQLWSLENQYNTWLEVELAVTAAQARLGFIPAREAEDIARLGRIDMARILEIEETVRHDVIAFVTSIEELVGPSARYFHYGLTSSDVVDTALALRLLRAGSLILKGLDGLLEALKTRAHEFKETLIIGRSHGIHAEPTTFGLKLALFYAEFTRHRRRFTAALKSVAVGQISGPVGNYSAPGLSPQLEELALSALGLTPEPVSNQIIQRDRHAEYFSALALMAASVEKLAVEIRHLARTEVSEVEEAFADGQKGSSAMPHKKNPIGSENLSGLARVVRGHALAALENVPLWHERDISHSSVERIIAPDATSLVDYMLSRLAGLIKNLKVNQDRMKANLELTGGLYNSQEVLLALCRKGLSRVEAYAPVQKTAFEASRTGRPFKELLAADSQISALPNRDELETIFSYDRFLKWVDTIFMRVFTENDEVV